MSATRYGGLEHQAYATVAYAYKRRLRIVDFSILLELTSPPTFQSVRSRTLDFHILYRDVAAFHKRRCEEICLRLPERPKSK